MKARAIDISACQPTLDYPALKRNGVEYAFIKASQGTYEDYKWTTHVNGCISAGITKIGSYSYIVAASVAEVKEHAKVFIKALDKFKGKINCPVYADMEDKKYFTGSWTKESRTKVLVAFLEEVKKAGYYVGVYINPSWLESFVCKEQLIGKYDIWLAAWTENPDKNTKWDYGQRAWQWGLDKTLGVPGGVDGDLVFVDYPAIVKKSGLNFLTAAEPSATPIVKPSADDKVEEVNFIMQSVGSAAIRSNTSKIESDPQRCRKGDYYAFDRKITKANGELWLRHACIGLYSMYKDGAYLFRKEAEYTRYKTTSALKVRSAPSLSGNKIDTFCAGAYVFILNEDPVSADGHKWVKCLAGGKIGYCAKEYLVAI